MSNAKTILTPVGRIVQGSLYKGNDKDAEGKPLVTKSGPNAGQARLDYYFAIAIPKIAGHTHWSQTDWGQLIWATGHAAFPQAAQSPTFAWKVKDGDSTIPNRKGKRPCDQEGFPGHWILSFSSGFPPKIYNANGTQQILEPDAVKPGYYVQVYGTLDGNGSTTQPGVYLNHNMVAFVAHGQEIYFGPDASAVGFGQNVQLPPGASATPLPGAFNPAPPVPNGPPGYVAPPAYVPPAVPQPAAPVYAAPPAAPVYTPPQPAAPVYVAPNPAVLAPPVPMAPVAPPAAPVRRMTAKAGGHSYETLIAGGWTDVTLVQQGLMEQ